MWRFLWFFLKILVFSFFTVSFCICHCPLWGILSSLPYYSKSQEKVNPKHPLRKLWQVQEWAKLQAELCRTSIAVTYCHCSLTGQNIWVFGAGFRCLSGVWVRERSGPSTRGCGRPKAATLAGGEISPSNPRAHLPSPVRAPDPGEHLPPLPPVPGKALSGSNPEYRQVQQVPLKAGGLFGLSWWHFAFSDEGDAWHKKQPSRSWSANMESK